MGNGWLLGARCQGVLAKPRIITSSNLQINNDTLAINLLVRISLCLGGLSIKYFSCKH